MVGAGRLDRLAGQCLLVDDDDRYEFLEFSVWLETISTRKR
ncbi:hypothetical protein X771_08520 [Mesorhizobium sp. LSJC277A00]|nr:hypothetical protein X771_08520 [Mesorhizobium sp. LSJC277A00]